MDILIALAVFVLGFATMFFGAISGGVGLVTRPILVLMGFPASAVISSSRVAVVGEWPGLYLLHKHNKIDWSIVLFLVIPMTIGAVLATLAVLTVFKSSINRVLGVLLLLAGLFFLFKGRLGVSSQNNRFSKFKSSVIAFFGTLPIAFFGTITGGLGPLYSFFYIWVYGKNFIAASALWRTASNISALFSAIIFVISGVVDWQLCILLIVGFMIGGYFGTRYGLKKGEQWVRYIVLIITFAGGIKLLFF